MVSSEFLTVDLDLRKYRIRMDANGQHLICA